MFSDFLLFPAQSRARMVTSTRMCEAMAQGGLPMPTPTSSTVWRASGTGRRLWIWLLERESQMWSRRADIIPCGSLLWLNKEEEAVWSRMSVLAGCLETIVGLDYLRKIGAPISFRHDRDITMKMIHGAVMTLVDLGSGKIWRCNQIGNGGIWQMESGLSPEERCQFWCIT